MILFFLHIFFISSICKVLLDLKPQAALLENFTINITIY